MHIWTYLDYETNMYMNEVVFCLSIQFYRLSKNSADSFPYNAKLLIIEYEQNNIMNCIKCYQLPKLWVQCSVTSK